MYLTYTTLHCMIKGMSGNNVNIFANGVDHVNIFRKKIAMFIINNIHSKYNVQRKPIYVYH